ncbi:SAM-dependent methyltransferase [Spongiactinospora gelatinilytica]|uniref:SAM-dependent methyltransferase n=1 Tax=Spongiactinospora gelatinilytica TaxID=2666298 RepID=A0A2W2GJR1_9ACTN|nr:O-methyltransferase [Spongiactinospora gelatinilytica]PZG49766.1 SAM-dependent methyltransferase [Spongiactinospora gelatinilytica]
MKATYLDPAVGQYVLAHTTPPDDLLERLAVETRAATGGHAGMQISPEQGRFMTMIAQMAGAANVVEVGTFTGYSSICLARGLAPGGRMTCFDVSEEWTSIARRYWAEAGVADRIELVLGPAAETLARFPADPPIDLAFIDADKPGYPVYYELVMSRLAPGGVIIVDNTLRDGNVADPTNDAASTVVMRAFNDLVRGDARVTSVLLPVADGLTLIRKN